jgi:hypothetical protein
VIRILTSRSSALAASISQSIFVNGLFKRVSSQLPSLNPSAVISAGAANLQNLASDAEMLQTLRGIYASALRDVFIYALAAACVAFVFTFGMEWLNLKNAIKSEEGTKATGKIFNTTDGGAFRSLHSRAEEGSLKGMTTSTTLSLSPVSMDTPCEVKSLG